MLYWLADFSSTISIFNVFRYLTVRTGGAMFTGAAFVFLFFCALLVIATVFAALIWLNFSYQILLYGAAWARIRRDAEIRRGESASASTPYAS